MFSNKKKIHLIYYVPCLGTGGTERVVLNLCSHVSREFFDLELCSMSDGLIGDEIRRLDIPVRIVSCSSGSNRSGAGKIYNYIKMLLALHSLIKNDQPTVIHTHHYGPLLQTFLVRRFGMKRFGWLHTEHSRTDVHNSYSNRYYRMANPMLGPDFISGVADKVTSHMLEVSGIPSDRAITIVNGIDTTLYCQENRNRRRKELGFNNDDKIIGTIGNLRKEKNQQLLVCAFSKLANHFHNAHLVICGDGDCRAGLERLANDLGIAARVHFLGFRMDAHEIMSTYDVYCLPSVYEGLPLSILEAWAAQKPVVATDVIGISDIVRHEQNGLLVPLHDDVKMADALLTVLHDMDLAQRLSAKGHALLLDKYDLKHMVKQYEDIYKNIAA